MIRWTKDGKVDRRYIDDVSRTVALAARCTNELADALDIAVAALDEVVMYLGPEPPGHVQQCQGCDYEWRHALEAARNARKQIGADHAD